MNYKIAFDWRGKPETAPTRKPTQTPLFNGYRDPTNHCSGITITGQLQGQVDNNKRDALRRGGI